jgi:CO/xanthine dehydrogenase Mo-binding subunit
MDTTRRSFIQTTGLLVASVAAISIDGVEAFLQQPAAGPYPDRDFLQLDSWIVIRPDNTATFFVGKTDLGQGTGTAFRQIMSDELDIAFDNTTCVMGSTDITVDQGGSGGSDALQTDGYPMRRVAAEARRIG